jgi:hypothetical protein
VHPPALGRAERPLEIALAAIDIALGRRLDPATAPTSSMRSSTGASVSTRAIPTNAWRVSRWSRPACWDPSIQWDLKMCSVNGSSGSSSLKQVTR